MKAAESEDKRKIEIDAVEDSEPLLWAIKLTHETSTLVETYKVHMRYSHMLKLSRTLATECGAPSVPPFPPKTPLNRVCMPMDNDFLQRRREGLTRYWTAVMDSPAWNSETAKNAFYPELALQDRHTKAQPKPAVETLPAASGSRNSLLDLLTPTKSGEGRRGSAFAQLFRRSSDDGIDAAAPASPVNGLVAADAARRPSVMERLEEMLTPSKPRGSVLSAAAASAPSSRLNISDAPPQEAIPVGEPL